MDSIHYSLAVAANVEKARTGAGLTKLALSESSGIPRTSLDRKLKGQGDFTVRELKSLAIALETTARELATVRDVSAAA